MDEVTETLKELYKDGPPANTVNIARTISEKHSIMLPTTMRFMQIVHKAALGLVSTFSLQ